MLYTIADLERDSPAWLAKASVMNEEELGAEEVRLAVGVHRSFTVRHTTCRAIKTGEAKKLLSLPAFAARGAFYEDNYRKQDEKYGHDLVYRQRQVRKLMAKIWYLNSRRRSPASDPFASFRETLAKVFTERSGKVFGEEVKVVRAISNTDRYPESDSFKIELPKRAQRIRSNLQAMSHHGHRR